MMMSKHSSTPTAAVEQPVLTQTEQQALLTAYNLKQARKSYQEQIADIRRRLVEAPEAFDRVLQYAENEPGRHGGNVVDFIQKLDSNMRLDLIVKYAAKIEALQRYLEMIRPLTSIDVQTQIDRILASE
jgi:hypothetical protein